MALARESPLSKVAAAAATCVASMSWFASPSVAGPPSAEQSSTGYEYDPTRPITGFDLRYRYEDDTTTTQNDKQSLTFRVTYKVTLDPQWKLALRADLPITASNAITASDSDGRYEAGVGRPLVQAYVINIIDDRWAAAVGSKITAPAISGSQFGSGNWEATPGVAVRYMLPEISPGSYFVPQLSYDFSFAQAYPGGNASNLQFAPELNVALQDGWFVVFYPSTDIRWNYGDPLSGQTGRLFLPADVAVGRKFSDSLTASLEVSVPIVRDYPVYRFKTEARLSLNF